MALTNAERQKRYRNVTRNGVTKVTGTVTKTVTDSNEVLLRYITTEEFEALTERVQLLEEAVVNLTKAQVKSVALGISVPKVVNPLSKEAQASGRMSYLNR